MVAGHGVDAHAVGSPRAAWRIIARAEQKDAQQATLILFAHQHGSAARRNIFCPLGPLQGVNVLTLQTQV